MMSTEEGMDTDVKTIYKRTNFILINVVLEEKGRSDGNGSRY